ncbi:MAG: aminoglycoside 3'-phosphotransferase [Bacillota bacterium]|nr:aminoglycoside 3'-phosphotransferase [Bacillota bacterium]
MIALPVKLEQQIKGYSWNRITIGHSEATTFHLASHDDSYYIKIQSLEAKESLQAEKERLQWLDGKLPVPKVIYFGKDEQNEYLLISEVKGTNASDATFKSNVPLLMAGLAKGLKRIHAIGIEDCPYDQRLESKIEEVRKRVEKGLVDEEDFDPARRGKKSEELFRQLLNTRPEREHLVFTHGDYCLPNIIMSGNEVNGFIDVGRAGVADRYQDIALAVRSIRRNFGEEMVHLFLKEYGLPDVDGSKVSFYQLMDEFF